MKYVSKNSRLNVVLRPGIPANHLTGDPGRRGIYAQFNDGLLITDDPEMDKMLQSHKAFRDGDFVLANESGMDPYAYLRDGQSEPQHVMTEIRYGHPVGRNVSPVKGSYPPEILKMIQDQAIAIAQEMVPKLAADMVKDMLANAAPANAVAHEASGNSETVVVPQDAVLGSTVTSTSASVTTPPKPRGRPRKAQ